MAKTTKRAGGAGAAVTHESGADSIDLELGKEAVAGETIEIGEVLDDSAVPERTGNVVARLEALALEAEKAQDWPRYKKLSGLAGTLSVLRGRCLDLGDIDVGGGDLGAFVDGLKTLPRYL